jgi:hypothetical protein
MMRAIGRVQSGWSDARLADVAKLGLFCALFWLAKVAGERVSGVPGHSVALWIPVLMAAQTSIGRPGAAALVAMGGAWLAAFPGPSPLSLAGHVAGGAALSLLWRGQPTLPRALFAGAVAAVAKFGVRWLPVATLGLPAKFLAVGELNALLLHLGFGLLGGALGWLLCRRMRGGAIVRE